MRKGGILEGLPVYLFGSDSNDAPTVIVDNPELGRLDLSPVPGNARINIIVATNKEQLKNSRKALSGLEDGNLQLVQAAPGCFPFRDKSVGTILTLVSAKQEADQDPAAENEPAASTAELARVLSPDGCIIELTSGNTVKTAKENHSIDRWSRDQSYFVRPSSGNHYFVTKEDVPASDMLDQVHHGRLRSLQIRANTLLSHASKSSSRDSIGVTIYSSALCQTIIEGLACITEKIEGDATPCLTSSGSFGLFVKADWNALLLDGNQDGLITKLPLRDDVLATMEGNTDTLSDLQNIEDSALRSVLPEVVGSGTVCGQAYWIEKRIEGTPATKLWWKPASRRQAVKSGYQFLVDLHRSTAKPVQVDRQVFDALVSPHIACVEERVKQVNPGFGLDAFHEALWALFRGRTVPLVRTHGDFWQGNLLLSEDKMLVGVLDWDLSEEYGWPLIDLLHLLTFQQKWLAVWHFGRLVTWKLLPQRLSTWETAIVDEYCASLLIEDDLWPGFIALYWLQRMAQVVDVFDRSWFHRNAINPLPKIVESLSAT